MSELSHIDEQETVVIIYNVITQDNEQMTHNQNGIVYSEDHQGSELEINGLVQDETSQGFERNQIEPEIVEPTYTAVPLNESEEENNLTVVETEEKVLKENEKAKKLVTYKIFRQEEKTFRVDDPKLAISNKSINSEISNEKLVSYTIFNPDEHEENLSSNASHQQDQEKSIISEKMSENEKESVLSDEETVEIIYTGKAKKSVNKEKQVADKAKGKKGLKKGSKINETNEDEFISSYNGGEPRPSTSRETIGDEFTSCNYVLDEVDTIEDMLVNECLSRTASVQLVPLDFKKLLEISASNDANRKGKGKGKHSKKQAEAIKGLEEDKYVVVRGKKKKKKVSVQLLREIDKNPSKKSGKALSEWKKIQKMEKTGVNYKKKQGRKGVEGEFPCNQCDYVAKQISHLQAHRSIHVKKWINCKYCDFATRSETKLMEHEARHTGDKPFICDFEGCDYAGVCKGDLMKHKRKHQTDKPFKCPHCDFSTKWPRNIRHHLLTHTDERPYACKECGYSFKRQSDLNYHMYRHSDVKPLKCDQCNFRCKTNFELKSHALKHSDIRQFKCTHPGCTQATKTKSDLTKHMKVHLKTLDFVCDLCGKGFKTKSCLKKHQLRHSDERPWKCDICNRRFKVKPALRNHINMHAGYKPHSCDICGLMFYSLANKRTHMVVHDTKNRFLKCPICPYLGKSQDNLLTHIGAMHGSKYAYFCEICKKPFKRYHQLQVHYPRCHTKEELAMLDNTLQLNMQAIKEEAMDEITKSELEKKNAELNFHCIVVKDERIDDTDESINESMDKSEGNEIEERSTEDEIGETNESSAKDKGDETTDDLDENEKDEINERSAKNEGDEMKDDNEKKEEDSANQTEDLKAERDSKADIKPIIDNLNNSSKLGTLAIYDGFRLPLATIGFNFNFEKRGKKTKAWFMDQSAMDDKAKAHHQKYLKRKREEELFGYYNSKRRKRMKGKLAKGKSNDKPSFDVGNLVARRSALQKNKLLPKIAMKPASNSEMKKLEAIKLLEISVQKSKHFQKQEKKLQLKYKVTQNQSPSLPTSKAVEKKKQSKKSTDPITKKAAIDDETVQCIYTGPVKNKQKTAMEKKKSVVKVKSVKSIGDKKLSKSEKNKKAVKKKTKEAIQKVKTTMTTKKVDTGLKNGVSKRKTDVKSAKKVAKPKSSGVKKKQPKIATEKSKMTKVKEKKPGKVKGKTAIKKTSQPGLKTKTKPNMKPKVKPKTKKSGTSMKVKIQKGSAVKPVRKPKLFQQDQSLVEGMTEIKKEPMDDFDKITTDIGVLIDGMNTSTNEQMRENDQTTDNSVPGSNMSALPGGTQDKTLATETDMSLFGSLSDRIKMKKRGAEKKSMEIDGPSEKKSKMSNDEKKSSKGQSAKNKKVPKVSAKGQRQKSMTVDSYIENNGSSQNQKNDKEGLTVSHGTQSETPSHEMEDVWTPSEEASPKKLEATKTRRKAIRTHEKYWIHPKSYQNIPLEKLAVDTTTGQIVNCDARDVHQLPLETLTSQEFEGTSVQKAPIESPKKKLISASNLGLDTLQKLNVNMKRPDTQTTTKSKPHGGKKLVALVDQATGKVIHSRPKPKKPQNIAFDKETGNVVVENEYLAGRDLVSIDEVTAHGFAEPVTNGGSKAKRLTPIDAVENIHVKAALLKKMREANNSYISGEGSSNEEPEIEIDNAEDMSTVVEDAQIEVPVYPHVQVTEKKISVKEEIAEAGLSHYTDEVLSEGNNTESVSEVNKSIESERNVSFCDDMHVAIMRASVNESSAELEINKQITCNSKTNEIEDSSEIRHLGIRIVQNDLNDLEDTPVEDEGQSSNEDGNLLRNVPVLIERVVPIEEESSAMLRRYSEQEEDKNESEIDSDSFSSPVKKEMV